MNIRTRATELFSAIQELISLHAQLSELLREEYLQMVGVDLEALASSTQRKDTLLSEIWRSEQNRKQITKDLCEMLGIADEQISLTMISERVPSPQKEDLLNARNVLFAIVEKAKDLNVRNMEFANKSLTRVDQMKRNVLGVESRSSKENYSQSGARNPTAEQGGRLISTEA